MASFNKITIVGYLGRDPELRYTPQGTPVCDFSIATTERRKQNGEPQDVTTWFRVTFWGRQAEIASQYLQKGRQVYVEGRLTAREWQDRENVTRTSLEVNGSDLQFIGSNGEANAPRREAAAAAGAAAQVEPGAISDDDIPF